VQEHRQCAQQRLRAAADLDESYTQRNQYMGAGDRSEIPERSSNLERIFVAGANGAQVPPVRRGALRARPVAARGVSLTIVSVDHVSFNILPDVPLEVATSNIQRASRVAYARGHRGSFDGNAGDFKRPAGGSRC